MATAAFFQPRTASTGEGTSDRAKEAATMVPWVEKFRPRTVDDVAHQDEVVEMLRKSLTGSEIPHLLFYGPPGTGKTSTILALSRQLYGPSLVKQRVLELNASDERGIDVVREKIKTFAQGATSVVVKGYPCPPYKIIILDESDSLTADAQTALRRVMENYAKTTRFCLICNYVSRIIEPLASRCAKFRFKPLPVDTLTRQLRMICGKESLECDDEALSALVRVSDGDMRKSIMFLQSASRLRRSGQMSAADFYNIAGVVPEELIVDLLKACRTNSYSKVEQAVRDLVLEGYAAAQIAAQLAQRTALPDEALTDNQRAQIAIRIAQVDHALMDGADEYLQLMDLATSILACIASGPTPMQE